MEGSHRKDKENASIFLCAVFVVTYLLGHGALILGGLSSVQDEEVWFQYPITLSHSNNQSRVADLEIRMNRLYRLGSDFVANQETRWIFIGRIIIYGSEEFKERDFLFFFHNDSHEYFSDRVRVNYGEDSDYGNKSIVIDKSIKFYRPGGYTLRVVDDVGAPEINFTSPSRVFIADEVVVMVEDFRDDVIGSMLIISGLLIIVLLSSAWDRLELKDYWKEAKDEWTLFWRSWQSDILILLWMLVAFDIITTLVALSHGGWESNEMARKDMYGFIWLTVLFFLGFSFLGFFLRSNKDRWWKRPDLWLFAFFVLIVSYMRVYAVTNNLEVVAILAGQEAFLLTLGVILSIVALYVIFLAFRIITTMREKRGSSNDQRGGKAH